VELDCEGRCDNSCPAPASFLLKPVHGELCGAIPMDTEASNLRRAQCSQRLRMGEQRQWRRRSDKFWPSKNQTDLTPIGLLRGGVSPRLRFGSAF
jgi:hypothetical protein